MSETKTRRPATPSDPAPESTSPAAAAVAEPDLAHPMAGVDCPDHAVAAVMKRLAVYVQHLPGCEAKPCTCGLADIIPTLPSVQMTARRYGTSEV
jgi:hypothetical protein